MPLNRTGRGEGEKGPPTRALRAFPRRSDSNRATGASAQEAESASREPPPGVSRPAGSAATEDRAGSKGGQLPPKATATDLPSLTTANETTAVFHRPACLLQVSLLQEKL
jgi:hypothetical protein